MYHTLIIVGNVGKDAEMRYTPSGQPVTAFSVATNRQYENSNGEKVKETIWFNVTTWGKLAEVCHEYVKKGMSVLVEGRLTADDKGNPRIWKDKDGEAHAAFEVTAGVVRFMSRSNRDDEQEVQRHPSEEDEFNQDTSSEKTETVADELKRKISGKKGK